MRYCKHCRGACRPSRVIAKDLRKLADRQNQCVLRSQAEDAGARSDAYASLQPESLLRWALELEGRCPLCASREAQRLVKAEQDAFAANQRCGLYLEEVALRVQAPRKGKKGVPR